MSSRRSKVDWGVLLRAWTANKNRELWLEYKSPNK